jgi:putative ABC transport system permease protein
MDMLLSTGEQITIQFADQKVNYTIRGVYSDPYDSSSSFNSAILIYKIPKSIRTKLRVILYAKDGVKGSEIEEAYRMKYDGQMTGFMITLEDRIDSGMLVSNIIGAVLLAMGIIMLLVSCLILQYMIRNSMITDAKTIAIYKTMGYTSGDILKMYLFFYFILVSIACILGIISSVFLSDIVLAAAFEDMGLVVSYNLLLPGIPCYVLTTGFVLGIIYLIINKTRKVKPVYALNGMSQVSTRRKKVYKGNYNIPFSAFGIASRSLLRSRKSAINVIITSMVTIFIINYSVISLDVAYGLKENNDYWLGIDKSDVIVEITNKEQFNTIQNKVKKDSRVKYCIPNNDNADVTMKWKKGTNTTDMTALVYDDFKQAHNPVVKGSNPAAGNEIAISSKIAADRKKEVGDYIEIYLGGEKRVNLLITGIFQSFWELGDTCRLTTDTYTENNYDFKYNNLSIYLKDKSDMKGFMADLKKMAGSDGNVIARTESHSNVMDMIAGPQKKAVPPVCALMLLVAAINIFCIVMLKNASNEKINGIYKSIGYSARHLILSNLYYVGMVVLASMLMVLPFTLVFYSKIMKNCFGVFGFLEYRASYNTGHIVWTNVFILILFAVSTLLSSRSIKKVNVRDLVQE